jgi:hypothetical protein
MIHKGIEYTLVMTSTPGIWKWQFQIGDELKTGKTETRIQFLAIRRVQQRINRELKEVARAPKLSNSTENIHSRRSNSLRSRNP